MTTKTCFKCGAEKPLTSFYKHPKMIGGRVGKCKECNKQDVRENRLKKIEYYRSYDVRRFAENVKGFRDRVKRNARLWNLKNPEKYKAHIAVSYAIRSGKLVRGVCDVCGDVNVHGHHDDYSKPLDVRWLCPAHHAAHHRCIAKNMT